MAEAQVAVARELHAGLCTTFQVRGCLVVLAVEPKGVGM